jgi:hypothetical protein
VLKNLGWEKKPAAEFLGVKVLIKKKIQYKLWHRKYCP